MAALAGARRSSNFAAPSPAASRRPEDRPESGSGFLLVKWVSPMPCHESAYAIIARADGRRPSWLSPRPLEAPWVVDPYP